MRENGCLYDLRQELMGCELTGCRPRSVVQEDQIRNRYNKQVWDSAWLKFVQFQDENLGSSSAVRNLRLQGTLFHVEVIYFCGFGESSSRMF